MKFIILFFVAFTQFGFTACDDGPTGGLRVRRDTGAMAALFAPEAPVSDNRTTHHSQPSGGGGGSGSSPDCFSEASTTPGSVATSVSAGTPAVDAAFMTPSRGISIDTAKGFMSRRMVQKFDKAVLELDEASKVTIRQNENLHYNGALQKILKRFKFISDFDALFAALLALNEFSADPQFEIICANIQKLMPVGSKPETFLESIRKLEILSKRDIRFDVLFTHGFSDRTNVHQLGYVFDGLSVDFVGAPSFAEFYYDGTNAYAFHEMMKTYEAFSASNAGDISTVVDIAKQFMSRFPHIDLDLLKPEAMMNPKITSILDALSTKFHGETPGAAEISYWFQVAMSMDEPTNILDTNYPIRTEFLNGQMHEFLRTYLSKFSYYGRHDLTCGYLHAGFLFFESMNGGNLPEILQSGVEGIVSYLHSIYASDDDEDDGDPPPQYAKLIEYFQQGTMPHDETGKSETGGWTVSDDARGKIKELQSLIQMTQKFSDLRVPRTPFRF